jgi:ArsR family transcriptional regulator, arsenate/arsenite/antimonite-responsive transcriptional repressor
MTPRTAAPEPRQIPAMEQVFKALADETRLRILALLSRGEMCVCDIHETLGIPQSKTSRHLAYLRKAGLVSDRKAGLWVYYQLAEPDDPVLQTIMSAVIHCLGHVPDARARPVAAPVVACCGAAKAGSGTGSEKRGCC